MKKLFGVFYILFISGLIACGGSSSSSSSAPIIDQELVGNWEGLAGVKFMIVTLTSSGTMTRIVLDTDGDEGESAEMDEGSRGTWSADGTTLTIVPEYEWDESAADGRGDWVKEEDGDTMSMAYELSYNGSTVLVHSPDGDITLKKAAAPVPDANLTGTWWSEVEDDYDPLLVDETVRMILTLASDGSLTMEKRGLGTSGTDNVYLGTETGTYGIYHSTDGYKYLVVVITSWKEGSDPAISCFSFMRMRYFLNLFASPDWLVVAGGDETFFERQGTDPAEPAPDTNIVGMWQGEESIDDDDDSGTPEVDCDLLVTFNSDNSFERILLYQEDHEKKGEMCSGIRGHFTANNGDLVIVVDEEWYDGGWDVVEDFLDLTYTITGTTLSTTGEFDHGTISIMEMESIPEPAPSADLIGTWVATGQDNYNETGPPENVEYTIIINAAGNFILETVDTDTTEFVRYQSGTCGISTVKSVEYFTIVFKEMDDDYPIVTPDPDPFYSIIRMEYLFENNGTDPDTFTLNDELEFEKQ